VQIVYCLQVAFPLGCMLKAAKVLAVKSEVVMDLPVESTARSGIIVRHSLSITVCRYHAGIHAFQ
jgi:hypothetical protein